MPRNVRKLSFGVSHYSDAGFNLGSVSLYDRKSHKIASIDSEDDQIDKFFDVRLGAQEKILSVKVDIGGSCKVNTFMATLV